MIPTSQEWKKIVSEKNSKEISFSGANTKQWDHYVIPVLADEKPQTIVIHVGSNDIIKFNYHDVDVNDLAIRI